MKIQIQTEDLLKILLPLQSIVNDNHLIPALQNVKLDFSSSGLLATGNNLEVSSTNNLKVLLAVKKPVSFCVNYFMLLALLKSLTDKEITLKVDRNNINILHKKGNFDLPIESSKEFPVMQSEKFAKKAHVFGKEFTSALKVANKFILTDDLDAMASISLSIGKKIFVRSTDRNRLFEEKIKGKGDSEDILISGKSSVSLFSLLEETEEKIEMKYNKAAIFFKFDNKEIMVVQQSGIFPIETFKKVIGVIKEADPIQINVKNLVTALKRVSIMSSKEKYSSVKLNISKKRIVISCESEMAATKAEESMESKFFESRMIGYNYKYLIEILSVFEKEPDLFIDSRGCLFISQKNKIGALSPIMLKS